MRAIASRAPSGSASTGDSLIDGPGKHEGPQRCDLMRYCRAGGRERIRREPADVAVGGELAPGPALRILVVDRDALALERLGRERRIGRRLAPQRRLRLDHFANVPLDVARSPSTFPANAFAARSARAGVKPRVVCGHRGSVQP